MLPVGGKEDGERRRAEQMTEPHVGSDIHNVSLMQALLFNKCFYRSLSHPKYIRLLLQSCRCLLQSNSQARSDFDNTEGCGGWHMFGIHTLLASGAFPYDACVANFSSLVSSSEQPKTAVFPPRLANACARQKCC